MRVSVVNFCSTALEMLDFSSEMLIQNAGTSDFDYIVVTWNPTQKVEKWILDRPGIRHSRYKTNENLDYVPNLRAMMSQGFDVGLDINDYVCIVNTDMAFGTEWLSNLILRANEDTIPNSVHLTPVAMSDKYRFNFGIPEKSSFNSLRFWMIHESLFNYEHQKSITTGRDAVMTPEDFGGEWRNCATMPYIMHRKWWVKYGPWEPNLGNYPEAPDRRFFERCYKGGAKFVLCLDSICYHHEACERRGSKRPVGIENMRTGL